MEKANVLEFFSKKTVQKAALIGPLGFQSSLPGFYFYHFAVNVIIVT